MKRILLIVTVIAAGIGLWQLQTHRSQAEALAKTIQTKDTSGADITTDKAALKAYVAAHMGTGKTIFLKASFDRASAAANAAATPQANGQIYAQAQAACASHANSIVQAQCVQSYLASHSTQGANPQPVTPPNAADYTLKYPSPGWTADSAGIAFLVAAASLILTGYLFIVSEIY